jgi:hypothetical protein
MKRMSDSEKILKEEDLTEMGAYLKKLVLDKCYWNPDKTFNEIFTKIKQEISDIEFQRKFKINARVAYGWENICIGNEYLGGRLMQDLPNGGNVNCSQGGKEVGHD